MTYGVATISRLLKIIGLLCRISSLLQVSFAKESYNFKEPTHRSHPISICDVFVCDLCTVSRRRSTQKAGCTHMYVCIYLRIYVYAHIQIHGEGRVYI